MIPDGAAMKAWLKRGLKAAGFLLLNLFVSILLLEGVLALPLAFPGLAQSLPDNVLAPSQQLYIENRPIIAFNPSCMGYDPELTYSFKPYADCLQDTGVVRARYRINGAGFRDDEASLATPEIIVLGDSHAMGWGVEQNETFSAVLERQSGYRVLNTAVASYDTSREMRLLDRVDTSRLKYLIIQYCDNDVIENRIFLYHTQKVGQNVIVPRSEADYRQIVEAEKKKRAYFPGKYALQSAGLLFRRREKAKEESRKSPERKKRDLLEEVMAFLNAVTQGSPKTDLSQVRILVFQVNSHSGGDGKFLSFLTHYSKASSNPPYVQNLRSLDFSRALKRHEHFFKLDDHLNPAGHVRVSRERFLW
jgi:hypothetical protein